MDNSSLSDLSVESSAIQRLTAEQKHRLTEILDQYLLALERGAPMPTEDLFKQHPDLADTLQAYFARLDQLNDLAAGFALVGQQTGGSADVEDLDVGDRKQLGDFVLVREIGRGGMGVVYEANQLSLGRRVALKVLPFAAILDSKQITRFQHEAQAAAQIDHPNIVPVFAVGAERGVHYYAMQYIDGQPLDRALADLRRFHACADDRLDLTCETNFLSLPSPARGRVGCGSSSLDDPQASFLTARSKDQFQYLSTIVRLGIQAAEALHAAHEYGVIHRDIKPSNLLLDDKGKLWVTDFGLARCQNEVTLTKTGDVVGTMRYMSPEQARGQTALVDPRTDVYSLAVTIYELLTLRPAFPGDDAASLMKLIDQHEPVRPRQIRPEIPADLETVVLKGMAKEREDRYETASQFAEDLRRVLEGRPTLARPPSIPDRIGKWARRHRRVVVSGGLVSIAAIIGLSVFNLLISREKTRAEYNAQRADARLQEAHEAVYQFGTSVSERLLELPGAERVRGELLTQTLEYYHAFVAEAKDDPALKSHLALTYSKIGTITQEIGRGEEAIAAHRTSVELFSALVKENPGVGDYRLRLAVCHNNLAMALFRAGRTEDARSAFLEAIRLQRELRQTARRDEMRQQAAGDLALSLNNLGLLQAETGQTQEAKKAYDEALQLQQRLARDEGTPAQHRNLAMTFNNLSALCVAERPDMAANYYASALAHQMSAVDAQPDELRYQSDLALTYNNLGSLQSRLRHFAEATASYARAIEIQQGLVDAAPAQKSYRGGLAVSFNNLGLIQSRSGNPEKAERSFHQALSWQEQVLRQNPDDIDLQSSLGGIYNNLGIVLEDLQRPQDAAAAYKQAVEHQSAAQVGAPAVARYRFFLSKHYFNQGRVLRKLGRPSEAAKAALARRELWPNAADRLFTVAEELALALRQREDWASGETSAEECAEQVVATLRQAIKAGLKLPKDLHSQSAFAALKDHPEFEKLVRK